MLNECNKYDKNAKINYPIDKCLTNVSNQHQMLPSISKTKHF